MQHQRLKAGRWSLSLLPLSMAISQAWAQDNQTELEVERIMVTAQKRGENMQEVPLALSVISGKELERGNLQNLQDLQFSVPNLSMSVVSAFTTTVNLRGIPSNPNGVFNSGASPGLGIYIDGVVYSRPTGFNQELSNIEQVEVLRGPQGTLFGQNTNLGVVSITTKKPSDDTEARLKLDAGNFGLKKANAYISGGLVEGVLAASLSGFSVTRDGYQYNKAEDNSLFDDDRDGGRFQLRFTPDSRLTLDINADWLKDTSTPPARKLTDYAQGLGYIGVLSQQQVITNQLADGAYQVMANKEDIYGLRDNWGVDATLSYRFDSGHEFKAISARKVYDSLLANDTDGTSLRLSNSIESENNQQFTQELQLISPTDSSFRYVAGLYYLDNDAINLQRFFSPTGIRGIPTGLTAPYPTSFALLPNSGAEIDGEVQTQSSAFFTNLTQDLTEQLTAFAGLRYSRVDKDMQFIQGGYETSLPGFYLLNYVDIPLTQQSQSDDFLSWTTGLNYSLDADLHFYGKVAKGFKEGGYSFRPQSAAAVGGDVNNPQIGFGREQVLSYEFGAKTDLWQRRARLNLAAFYLDYQDIQTLVVDDNGVNQIVNGPSATSQGLEAELTLKLASNWSVKSSLGYADARFDEFSDCHAVDDCSGNQLPGSAKWTVTLASQLELPQLGDWGPYWAIDSSYRSAMYSESRNLAATQLGGNLLVNTQLGLVSDDGRIEVALWAKNLFDREYLVSLADKANSDLSFSTRVYGPPRTYGLSFSYHFY